MIEFPWWVGALGWMPYLLGVVIIIKVIWLCLKNFGD